MNYDTRLMTDLLTHQPYSFSVPDTHTTITLSSKGDLTLAECVTLAHEEIKLFPRCRDFIANMTGPTPLAWGHGGLYNILGSFGFTDERILHKIWVNDTYRDVVRPFLDTAVGDEEQALRAIREIHYRITLMLNKLPMSPHWLAAHTPAQQQNTIETSTDGTVFPERAEGIHLVLKKTGVRTEPVGLEYARFTGTHWVEFFSGIKIYERTIVAWRQIL